MKEGGNTQYSSLLVMLSEKYISGNMLTRQRFEGENRWMKLRRLEAFESGLEESGRDASMLKIMRVNHFCVSTSTTRRQTCVLSDSMVFSASL